MNRAERLRAIAQTHATWEQRYERLVEPEAKLTRKGPSQYGETVVTTSAPPEAENEFMRLLGEAAQPSS